MNPAYEYNSEEIRLAIKGGDSKAVAQFIQQNQLDPKKRFAFQNVTVWHVAVLGKEKRHLNLLQMLLKYYQADITPEALNQKEKNSLTPIHCAALEGNIKAIELLVMYGADPDLPNDEGVRPIGLFRKSGYAYLEGHMKAINYSQHELRRSLPIEPKDIPMEMASCTTRSKKLMHYFGSFFKTKVTRPTDERTPFLDAHKVAKLN